MAFRHLRMLHLSHCMTAKLPGLYEFVYRQPVPSGPYIAHKIEKIILVYRAEIVASGVYRLQLFKDRAYRWPAVMTFKNMIILLIRQVTIYVCPEYYAFVLYLFFVHPIPFRLNQSRPRRVWCWKGSPWFQLNLA